MSANTPEAGIRPQTSPAAKQEQVAPLLAAGLSIRQISAKTGISLGAVHRAKQQIRKAMTMSHTEPTSQGPTPEPVELPSPQPTSEVDPPSEPGEPPPSYIVQRT